MTDTLADCCGSPRRFLLLIILMAAVSPVPALAEPVQTLELSLRTRDPRTGEPATQALQVDPTKVAVVMVDTWNFH